MEQQWNIPQMSEYWSLERLEPDFAKIKNCIAIDEIESLQVVQWCSLSLISHVFH